MQEDKTSKRFSIVIVTHNSSSVIGQCLASIPNNIRIIVVDNNSSDNTVGIIKKSFPAVEIIKCRINLGFGRANNLALQKVKTEFALLLNPDTVIEENLLDNLFAKANEYTDAAIIAPELYHEDGSLQKSYKTSVFHREKHRSTYIKPDGDLCAECVSGAVMLLRMRCFNDKIFFDRNIFLFYEDDDICMRARKNGYSVVFTPHVRVKHLMGRSSPVTGKYIYIKNLNMIWSRLYMEQKYGNFVSLATLFLKTFCNNFFKSCFYLLTFNKKKLIKYCAGVVAAFLFMTGKKSYE